MSNVKPPVSPDDLAKAWPKVEASMDAEAEDKAISNYLAKIKTKKTPGPDKRKGRWR